MLVGCPGASNLIDKDGQHEAPSTICNTDRQAKPESESSRARFERTPHNQFLRTTSLPPRDVLRTSLSAKSVKPIKPTKQVSLLPSRALSVKQVSPRIKCRCAAVAHSQNSSPPSARRRSKSTAKREPPSQASAGFPSGRRSRGATSVIFKCPGESNDSIPFESRHARALAWPGNIATKLVVRTSQILSSSGEDIAISVFAVANHVPEPRVWAFIPGKPRLG